HGLQEQRRRAAPGRVAGGDRIAPVADRGFPGGGRGEGVLGGAARPAGRHPAMTRAAHAGLGLLAAAALAVLCEAIPASGLILLIGIPLLTVTAVAFGGRLPLALRMFATVSFFYFGYCMCPLGRTTAPGAVKRSVGYWLAYDREAQRLEGSD